MNEWMMESMEKHIVGCIPPFIASSANKHVGEDTADNVSDGQTDIMSLWGETEIRNICQGLAFNIFSTQVLWVKNVQFKGEMSI